MAKEAIRSGAETPFKDKDGNVIKVHDYVQDGNGVRYYINSYCQAVPDGTDAPAVELARLIEEQPVSLMSIEEVINYFGFESCTNYQMINVLEKLAGTYADAVENAALGWERMNADSPVPYFPQVCCGWDNNPRFKSVKTVQLDGANPALFKKALMNAKAFIDAHPDRVPLITINSWNEWTEGSYLEPDDLFGYGYLDAVKEVFGE